MEQDDFLNAKVVQGSLDGREAALVDWFARTLPGVSDVELLKISPPPAGSGYSAENYIIDLGWRGNGGESRQRFVLRRVSAGRQMFPGRDFAAERTVQEMVGALRAAPVPRIIGHEDDPSILGERFYVMGFIPGAIPPTNPSYHEAGWLAEMTPDRSRALWLNGLRQLGRLHAGTHGRSEIERFARDGDGRSEFLHALDYWSGHYDIGSAGQPIALMGEVADWLRGNAPVERNRAICWGDSRIGNALFAADGRCTGFVDWELFGLGDPTRDLAYWLYTDDHFVFASGKRIAGWPSYDESIVAYEAGAGFSVDRHDLDFYRIFQGYHIVSTLARLIQIKKEVGQLPADIDVGERFTPVAFLRQEWEGVLARR